MRRVIAAVIAAVTITAAFALPVSAATPVTGTGTDPARVVANCNASNVVCITSDRTKPLVITGSNKIYEGLGHKVPGITANGDNITIQGFVSTGAAGTGIWIKGRNPVIRDNTINKVHYAIDDIDGIRFFGDGAQIINNKETNILSGPIRDAHLDCMQTYASPSSGSSSNVTISGNYCSDTHFAQCVMAEGPGSTDGGGGASGDSRNWVIRSNYFQCYANQTIALRAIHNVLIDSNNFEGAGNKAVQITDGATATFRNNTLGPGYGTLYGD